MRRPKGFFFPLRLRLLLLACPVLAGCAILRLPFDILNGVWQVVKKLPLPPPWVF